MDGGADNGRDGYRGQRSHKAYVQLGEGLHISVLHIRHSHLQRYV